MATRIYVGNLPATVDKAQLAQVFGGFGEVVDAHIVTERDSGQSRGFAFIEMANQDATHQAITGLHGSLLGTHILTVKEAQPRAERNTR